MKDTTISENIVYIGVDDKTIDLFESQYIVPNGVSYNSYLILDEKTKHPDMDVLVDDLKQKNLAGLSGHMGNLLETVTIEKYPVIRQIKQVMRDFGSLGAMMSGSGPTVFGIFEEETKAKVALDEIRKRELAKQLYITRPYNL